MQDLELLFFIANIFKNNESIFIHGERVAKFACAIAREMQYCDEGIRQIYLAAFVHDIGKINLPPEIINKPSRLDHDEILIVREHPELGYRILKDMKPECMIAEATLQHHERLNGSGYPFGLRGKNINPVARIIAVADVFDTMVFPQVYRPGLTINEALQEIKQNSGLLYDPEVVVVSLSLIEKGELSARNVL